MGLSCAYCVLVDLCVGRWYTIPLGIVYTYELMWVHLRSNKGILLAIYKWPSSFHWFPTEIFRLSTWQQCLEFWLDLYSYRRTSVYINQIIYFFGTPTYKYIIWFAPIKSVKLMSDDEGFEFYRNSLFVYSMAFDI